MEIALSKDILEALTENVLKFQQDIEDQKKANSTDEKRVEKNVNKKNDEVSTQLTSNEITRYQKIGAEFFKSTIQHLEKIIKREKKAQRMAINIPKESKSFKKKLSADTGASVKPVKKSDSFWTKLLAVVAGLSLLYAIFKDEIDAFFKKAWNEIKKLFGPIENVVKSISKGFSWICEKLKPIAEWIYNALKEMLAPIGKYFDPKNPNNIFSDIGKFIVWAAEGTFKVLGVIFDASVEGVKWIADQIWSILKSIGSTIGGIVTKAFDVIADAFSAVGSFLTDTLTKAINSLFGGDGEVPKLLADVKSEARDASSQVLGAVNADAFKNGDIDRRIKDVQSFAASSRESLNKELGTTKELKEQLAKHHFTVEETGGKFNVSIRGDYKDQLIRKIGEEFGYGIWDRVKDVTSSNTDGGDEDAFRAKLGEMLAEVAPSFIEIGDDHSINVKASDQIVKDTLKKWYKWVDEHASTKMDTNDIADNIMEAMEDDNQEALDKIQEAAKGQVDAYQAQIKSKIDALNAHAQADGQNRANYWKYIESQGLGPGVRHDAAMKRITEVTDTLNKSLDQLHKTIGDAFVALVNEKLLKDISVESQTIDGRTANVVINQINVDSLDKTLASIKEIETKNRDTLELQNTVLQDILTELEKGAERNQPVNNVNVVNSAPQNQGGAAMNNNAARNVPRPKV